jgi:hypothetical protein
VPILANVALGLVAGVPVLPGLLFAEELRPEGERLHVVDADTCVFYHLPQPQNREQEGPLAFAFS